MAGILKFIETVCVEDAVYWQPGTDDGYGGKTRPSPVIVKVRWDEMAEVTTSTDGKEFVSRAVVMSPSKLDPEGYLQLRDPDDMSALPATPTGVSGAWQIRRVEKTPLFRSNKDFVWRYFL